MAEQQICPNCGGESIFDQLVRQEQKRLHESQEAFVEQMRLKPELKGCGCPHCVMARGSRCRCQHCWDRNRVEDPKKNDLLACEIW